MGGTFSPDAGIGYDRRFGRRGDDHALSLRYRLGV
ncbi:hypothetical protein J2Y70_000395 [Xanthomonas translucens]|nr:hypothetical protein [Xanthomonas translucens]